MWVWREKAGLKYLTLPAWEEAGVEIGFSSRGGGVSEQHFSSLNLGLHVGDEPQRVLENRRRWLGLWQADWNEVAIAEQVHGTGVVWLDAEAGGRGSRDLRTAIPGTDGLLTKDKLGLMAFFADCVPLFFYHPKLKAVGIAHAGWKGTAGKIALPVLDELAQAGGQAEDCWAAIGPAIGPCCYEVDEPVAARLRTNFTETVFLRPSQDGHYQLDLWQANKEILLGAGIKPEHIWSAELCTACRPAEFFSHRRDGGLSGRLAGWIRRRS
ncbi:MAG: peptidoglycan editing factor PgeF [Desulfitobacteriaceae bacterium]